MTRKLFWENPGGALTVRPPTAREHGNPLMVPLVRLPEPALHVRGQRHGRGQVRGPEQRPAREGDPGLEAEEPEVPLAPGQAPFELPPRPPRRGRRLGG